MKSNIFVLVSSMHEFDAAARKLKPRPNKSAVQRAVLRVIQDMERKKHADVQAKRRVLARLGKYLRRAAYAATMISALAYAWHRTRPKTLIPQFVNGTLENPDGLAELAELAELAGNAGNAGWSWSGIRGYAEKADGITEKIKETVELTEWYFDKLKSVAGTVVLSGPVLRRLNPRARMR